MKRIILLVSCVVFLTLSRPIYAVDTHERLVIQFKKSQSSQVITALKSKLTPEIFSTVKKESNEKINTELDKIHTLVLQVPYEQRNLIIDILERNSSVESIEYDAKAKALSLTDDPDLSKQWGLYTVAVAHATDNSAWDITTGSATVKAAVVDTGIDLNHPDLQGRVVLSKDFTGSTNGFADGDGHGTHIAGILAAGGNNTTGGAGVAYNTSLLNAKVLDNNGSGYYTWIASGVIWAADQGAHVINLSLGGNTDAQVLKDAINYAWGKGAVVVAAAGNTGGASAMYPAYYDSVIGVGSVTNQDTKSSFSNYGAHVSLAAPGDKIFSTYTGSKYVYMTGTSMSSAFVSGAAALLFAQGTCTTNVCVRTTLQNSADQTSGTGTSWKYGRLNVLKALQQSSLYADGATPTPTLTPTPTPVPPTPTPTSTDTTPTMTPSPTLTPPTPTPTPATSPTSTQMSVTSIALNKTIYFFFPQITATVTVKSGSDQPLGSSTVRARLISPSGIVYTGSKTTNSSGIANYSFYSFEKGIFTFRIDSVTKSGYGYVPNITEKTIVVN